MTPSSKQADITLSTVRGVAASLPHLLGFYPEESLVCLWMRERLLVVAQRADLPSIDEPVDHEYLAEYVQAFLAAAGNIHADEVVVAIVDGRDWIVAGVAQALLDALAKMPSAMSTSTSVRVRSLLAVRGSQVRDMMQESGQWEWIDTSSRQCAAAAIGRSEPARSRGRIQTECDPSIEDAGAGLPGDDLRLTDQATADLIDFIEHGPAGRHLGQIGDRTLRHAISGRTGRDIVLWWAARATIDSRHELLTALLRCTRATPPGAGGNVAVAASVVAWLCGDGVRANVALDRCLHDDSGNRMGALMSMVIGSGVPPTQVEQWLGSVPWSVLCTWEYAEDPGEGEPGCQDAADTGSFVDERAS